MADRVPCALPPLPAPFRLDGVPDVNGETVTVTKDRLALLGGYLIGVRAWIRAANDCLVAP